MNSIVLKKAFDGDLDLMLFYSAWVKNSLNSTKAYKELHPDVTEGSAEVLGSRLLGKVRELHFNLLLEAYGINYDLYFTKLNEGLGATKLDITGKEVPDHEARLPYFETLGKLLGLEGKNIFGFNS